MANKLGTNYTLEWATEPQLKAAKATRNAAVKGSLDSFTGVAAADVLFICKLQQNGIFLGLEEVVGTLGAGAVKAIDKAGNETTIVKGDVVNGQKDGGLDIVLVADAGTSAAVTILAKFLMD